MIHACWATCPSFKIVLDETIGLSVITGFRDMLTNIDIPVLKELNGTKVPLDNFKQMFQNVLMMWSLQLLFLPLQVYLQPQQQHQYRILYICLIQEIHHLVMIFAQES